MKNKILMCLACCILLIPILSGCTDFDDVEIKLGDIRVENILPKVNENSNYLSLYEIDELVYEQQIAACIMFKDACELTNYEQFLPKKKKSKKDDESYTWEEEKIINLANRRRHIIYDDIEVAFAVNIYRLLQNVEDCPNTDAYVLKAQSDVKDFFDDYDRYINGENPEEALLDILKEYRVKSNVLVYTFLDKNKAEVCRASVNKVAENAKQTEDLRVYVSENNEIIKSLNEIYGSIPSQYADNISADANFLVKKLVLSLESLSQKEKQDLINQIDPTPRPTTTPETNKMPDDSEDERSTPNPTASATPKPTVSPTARPTATPTPRPTATPRPVIIPTPEPTPVPTPEPIIIDGNPSTPEPPLVFE